MGDTYTPTSGVKGIKQSPPVDFTKPYDVAWLKDKHIIITGGASPEGFGAGFVRKWAAAGASIVVGDINTKVGDQTVRDIRKETGNEKVHFVQCDVRDWLSQVNLFREAVKVSPHGGIDCVVANAGVAGIEPLQMPANLDVPEPKKPNFKVIEVNLIGVLYTVHLALFWLQKNPGSKSCSINTDPSTNKRDRHILLVGSLASIGPIISQPLYGTSKHGVLGLFRTLRASSFIDGCRTNIICPYFIETPMVPTAGRLILAGGASGRVEDVVDAATRLTADSSILGRGLCIGPKARVKQEGDDFVLSENGEEKAIWEIYADDFVDTEIFTQRFIRILNGIASVKGWYGFGRDAFAAIKYGIFG
ncbi:NAD(P)-binding protein [Tothia fuscella]|uniref:NAD(P)-binding protein n=1 Tax=Tothia fuscella TaxID=1048955 RepID=A0A9P4P4I3_9PEZI|nr:NAD(P)-binding protein [Tothia fuscella]